MKPKKDERLNFKNWIIKNPFNQITKNKKNSKDIHTHTWKIVPWVMVLLHINKINNGIRSLNKIHFHIFFKYNLLRSIFRKY